MNHLPNPFSIGLIYLMRLDDKVYLRQRTPSSDVFNAINVCNAEQCGSFFILKENRCIASWKSSSGDM